MFRRWKSLPVILLLLLLYQPPFVFSITTLEARRRILLVAVRAHHFLFLFVSHLRPMDLSVLGYQSHLLQRCHPAWVPRSSHLSPILVLHFFHRDESSALLQDVNHWFEISKIRRVWLRCPLSGTFNSTELPTESSMDNHHPTVVS